MRRIFTILLTLAVLLVLGWATATREKKADKTWDSLIQTAAKWKKQRETKLNIVCEKKMIPAAYGSECYFRELKDCASDSGKLIAKSELKKCVPFYLKKEIEATTDY